MALKINKEKLDKLSPEDAIPLVLRVRKWILGKKRPDAFTRWVYTINILAWVLLMAWNLISYGVVLMSDFIKANKGFSVNEILRSKGREMGFQGPDFLDMVTLYYFLSIFVWGIIFIGLVLLYRKSRYYGGIYFVGFALHFAMMLFMLGLQYFLEHVSSFDKVLYGIMLISGFIHYTLLMKEKNAELGNE